MEFIASSVHPVRGDPLEQTATRPQRRHRRRERTQSVNRSEAPGHPRVEGLGDDDVVAVATVGQMRAPIVEDHANARILQGAPVHVIEEA